MGSGFAVSTEKFNNFEVLGKSTTNVLEDNPLFSLSSTALAVRRAIARSLLAKELAELWHSANAREA